METFRRYKIPVIITIILLVLALVGIYIYQTFYTFRVTSSSPEQNSVVSYQTPLVRISFNKEISSENISLELPKELVTSYFVEKNSLNINIFSGLVANKEYDLVVKSISSKDGMKLGEYKIHFSTNSSNALAKDDEKIILERQQSNKPSLLSDPVLEHVPYNTREYYIEPYLDTTSDGNGAITLKVTVYLSRDDLKSGRDVSIQRIQNSAKEYLNSLEGVVLSNYSLVYKTQEPQ